MRVTGKDGAVVASVPDLITVLDAETGEPITTETLRYGFRVVVVGMPCAPPGAAKPAWPWAEAWLDLVEQTGMTPDGLGASDHVLYIGHMRSQERGQCR